MTGSESFLAHYKIKNRRIGLDVFCTSGRRVSETVNNIITESETSSGFRGKSQSVGHHNNIRERQKH